MKHTTLTATALVLAAVPAFAATKGDVLTTYADIARAGYEDSLTTAQTLNDAVNALIASPSEDTLAAARAAWGDSGEARETVLSDEDAGIAAILTGMGSLSYGEQAGERMRLGLLLNDPEEEHDCFSDNTHRSHYNDGLGVQNVYLGSYTRVDGSTVEGASHSDLVAATDADLDAEMKAKQDSTMVAMTDLSDTAEGGMAYDQMLAPGNAEGEAIIMAAIDGLIDQTATIERIVAKMGLGQIAFEGSDSLDNPDAVFQ